MTAKTTDVATDGVATDGVAGSEGTRRRFSTRAHPVRRTVRLRLTLLYGALFLVSGTALLGFTYWLVNDATSVNAPFAVAVAGARVAGGSPPLSLQQSVTVPAAGHSFTHVAGGSGRAAGETVSVRSGGLHLTVSGKGLTKHQVEDQVKNLQTLAAQEHAAAMHQLFLKSGVALGLMALLSILLGWLVAGRVLRPLRKITATAREISATNLDRRIELSGPRDELKELSDTFDGLLARLDRSFEAQRRFVANASHELRTPLARQRALIQVALADPDATVETLRHSHERVLAAGEQEERLIDALLTLSRGEAGVERSVPLNVAEVATEVLAARRDDVARQRLNLSTSLAPCPVDGDRRLVERLMTNLIDNAVHHNVVGGWLSLSTGVKDGGAELVVGNSGPVIPPDALTHLTEPFRRVGPDRMARRDGHGLGLSIVKAVADAHHATLDLRALPAGGLEAVVRFPPRQAHTHRGPDTARHEGTGPAPAPRHRSGSRSVPSEAVTVSS